MTYVSCSGGQTTHNNRIVSTSIVNTTTNFAGVNFSRIFLIAVLLLVTINIFYLRPVSSTSVTTKPSSTLSTLLLQKCAIVHLKMTLEYNQVEIYQEFVFRKTKESISKGFVNLKGNLWDDMKNINSKIKPLSNTVIIKASLSSHSRFLITCYHDHLLRLLVNNLNCSLLMLGRMSSCNSEENTHLNLPKKEKHLYSMTTFLLTVPENNYQLLYRDFIYTDTNVWSEALIIYDKPESFLRFRRAIEISNKILHIRSWGSNRKSNAKILKSFMHIRTFIIDMDTDNVHSFFMLASGLHLLDSMTSNVILIDQNTVIDSIRDFPFMVANITVIRPTIMYRGPRHEILSAVNYSHSTLTNNEFERNIYIMFMKELKKSIQKLYAQVSSQFKKTNFLPPTVWVQAFNASPTNHLKLQFNKDGEYLFNFNFESVSLNEYNSSKISYWTKGKGFVPIVSDSNKFHNRLLDQIYNKTFRVTTMKDPPFVMYREQDEHGTILKGNDRYHGMAIDLLNALSRMKNFKYVLHTVGDNTFGTKNETSGKWNGMIGEIINNQADMVVASFTITYDRERVIDFTTPWMSLGLSIVIKKSKSGSELLQFMAPLSINVWLMMLGAYIVVSFTLCIVGRLTPYEWYVKFPCHNKIENQFSMLNSFWFTVGSLMQQGCDISPRATSTRMISTVWWFFILIMISSYTANLAAFLTIERLQTDINSVEELSRQTKVKYGTLYGGSTYSFFKNSNISTYRRMWNFMNNDKSVFVDSSIQGIEKVRKGDYAFILESSLNEYYTQRDCSLMPLGGLLDSRGYAIGLAPGNNVLRDILSEGILRLQKDQVLEEYRRKWLMKFNLTKSCFEHNSHSSTIRNQLDLDKMGGAFFGLLIGLAASCLVSWIETIAWACKRAIQTGSTICHHITKQITLAACYCHRYKPANYDSRSLSPISSTTSRDSPLIGGKSMLTNDTETPTIKSQKKRRHHNQQHYQNLHHQQQEQQHHHYQHSQFCHHHNRKHRQSSCSLSGHKHHHPLTQTIATTTNMTHSTIKAGSATITIPTSPSYFYYQEHESYEDDEEEDNDVGVAAAAVANGSSGGGGGRNSGGGGGGHNRVHLNQQVSEPLCHNPSSPEFLYRPLPLERALLMKCNSTENIRRYTCYYNSVHASPNGVLPGRNAHKVTSL